MLMAVLGHTTLSEAGKNCDETDQAGLAADAMKKLEGRKQNGIAQTTSLGLENLRKQMEGQHENGKTGAP